MATYKITGTVNDSCTIYIIQDDEYKGKRFVSAGDYELIFESTSSGTITAVAENSNGTIVGFGDITPVNATGESINWTAAAGGVKSIQPISITIPAETTSADQILSSSINTSQSFIIYNGSGSYVDPPEYWWSTLYFVDSTTVRAEIGQGGYGSYAATVKGYVIELDGIVNSIQRGIISMPYVESASPQIVDETISGVDLSKTFVTHTVKALITAGAGNYVAKPHVWLTSSTNLRATRQQEHKNRPVEVRYEVVELDI